MTLVERPADNRIRSNTDTRNAVIFLRAGIAIITRRPVGLGRVGTQASRRVAHTRHMALVERRADHRIRAYTDTRNA